MVSSHASDRGVSNRSYSSAKSFSKRKVPAVDERELTSIPRSSGRTQGDWVSPTADSFIRTRQRKDDILVTRTVNVTSKSPREGIEDPENRTVVIERSFLDLDEPQSKLK